jgi:hypothetical protein
VISFSFMQRRVHLAAQDFGGFEKEAFKLRESDLVAGHEMLDGLRVASESSRRMLTTVMTWSGGMPRTAALGGLRPLRKSRLL